MIWLKLFAPAACYFLFHWQFFLSVTSALSLKPMRKRSLVATFFLNFTVFFLCSTLELHLIVNWTIFLFLLFGEMLYLFRRPIRECFLLGLLGTQLGLAVNILFRSLFAVILNVPLVAFDNNVMMPGTRKIHPVLMGFLVAGLLFLFFRRLRPLENLKLVFKSTLTLTFLLSLLMAMQFYLCLNLLVYNINENDLILKLWSMKSSIFVLVGQSLAVFFAVRVGRINAYRRESEAARQLLAEKSLQEQELRVIAAIDPLTGCENRLQAEKRLTDALLGEDDFYLCFVDLNGLKTVNDSFGHEMGDAYLLTVARVLGEVCGVQDCLFRYGGDEFLILLYDTDMERAERCFQTAQKLLTEKGESSPDAFPMSISYGFSSKEDGTDPESLIRAADSRMYRMKKFNNTNR